VAKLAYGRAYRRPPRLMPLAKRRADKGSPDTSQAVLGCGLAPPIMIHFNATIMVYLNSPVGLFPQGRRDLRFRVSGLSRKGLGRLAVAVEGGEQGGDGLGSAPGPCLFLTSRSLRVRAVAWSRERSRSKRRSGTNGFRQVSISFLVLLLPPALTLPPEIGPVAE
jgi:hypothetical protein